MQTLLTSSDHAQVYPATYITGCSLGAKTTPTLHRSLELHGPVPTGPSRMRRQTVANEEQQWTDGSASATTFFLHHSHLHGHQELPTKETNPQRHLQLHHGALSLLQAEQKRMAKFHQAQFVAERMLYESPKRQG